MPYQIKRVDGGYKVYTANGTPLSGKPLSLARAKQQKIAVVLSELRRRGTMRGGMKGGTAEEEAYSLSDTDIQKILGGTNVIKYPELSSMDSIDDAFDAQGRCVILYLTTDDSSGHWVCLSKHEEHIEYFDPYGGYKPDGERKWLSKEKLEELDQDEPVLTRMLKGHKVVSNPYKFQKEGGDINTCGRHCCARLLYKDLSLPEYSKMIKDSGKSADEFVTELTSQVIHK